MAGRRSKYHKKPGRRIDPKKIPLYARELKKIERSGPLTAERVVVYASDPLHPLHECFEWADQKAAHNYRLWQARDLIASVLIEIAELDDGPTRAFVNVTTKRGREYVSVERAMTDKELYAQVVEEAANRLRYWRQAYKQYKNLASIFGKAEGQVRKLKTG